MHCSRDFGGAPLRMTNQKQDNPKVLRFARDDIRFWFAGSGGRSGGGRPSS